MTHLCHASLTYMSFLASLAVGTSCGWFVINGLYNLAANEPKIAKGGQLIGEINLNGAVASLGLCIVFAIYPLVFGRINNIVEKRSSTLLIHPASRGGPPTPQVVWFSPCKDIEHASN